MSEAFRTTFITTILLIFCWVAWGLSDMSEHAKTVDKLDHWISGCQPDDIHYGTTVNENGQRAFIVTCGEKQ